MLLTPENLQRLSVSSYLEKKVKSLHLESLVRVRPELNGLEPPVISCGAAGQWG